MVFEIAANADETQFYAATEAGPYIYLAETQRWEDLSQGNTPAHTYWSVEYVEALDVVRFGTYGRGIWDFSFQEPVNIISTSLPLHKFANVFPNPVQNILNIEAVSDRFTSAEDIYIELYNSTGQLMQTHMLEQSNQQLDLSMLVSGAYTVRINDGKQMQVEKIIKL